MADAIILVGGGRYDAAAYMCGYVLETALKARICKHLQLADYPPAGFDRVFKTHDFDELKVLAGLGETFPQGASRRLQNNWDRVSDWLPEWRYRKAGTVSRQEAEARVDALAERPDGVLTWLRKRW